MAIQTKKMIFFQYQKYKIFNLKFTHYIILYKYDSEETRCCFMF